VSRRGPSQSKTMGKRTKRSEKDIIKPRKAKKEVEEEEEKVLVRKKRELKVLRKPKQVLKLSKANGKEKKIWAVEKWA